VVVNLQINLEPGRHPVTGPTIMKGTIAQVVHKTGNA
jgi:hypothetical protein